MQVKDLRYYLTIYAFNLAKRKTVRQRESFFGIVSGMFANFGYDCKLQTKKKAGNTIQNLIAGDLEKAERVYIGIYDNPGRMLLPRPRYYPLDMAKNKAAEILNVALHIVLIILGALVLTGVLLATRSMEGAVRTFLTAVTVVGLVALYSATAGKPAYLNFSRNAGLALLTLLGSRGEKRAAYVLCDMASASMLGFQVLIEENPCLTGKEVVIFDCLGDEEILLIGAAEKIGFAAKKLKEKIGDPDSEVVIPGPESYHVLSLFQRGILLSFCRRDDQGGYHADNLRTKLDNKVDIDRLQRIYEGLLP